MGWTLPPPRVNFIGLNFGTPTPNTCHFLHEAKEGAFIGLVTFIQWAPRNPAFVNKTQIFYLFPSTGARLRPAQPNGHLAPLPVSPSNFPWPMPSTSFISHNIPPLRDASGVHCPQMIGDLNLGGFTNERFSKTEEVGPAQTGGNETQTRTRHYG